MDSDGLHRKFPEFKKKNSPLKEFERSHQLGPSMSIVDLSILAMTTQGLALSAATSEGFSLIEASLDEEMMICFFFFTYVVLL